MGNLHEIIARNVAQPVIILSSLDPSLADLLPQTMNLSQGLTRTIQNGNGMISHPFGSIMRSIIFSIYDLEAREVFVIGQKDVNDPEITNTAFPNKMLENKQFQRKIKTLQHAGINIDKWLEGYNHPSDGLRQSVHMIKNHPLLPNHVLVHGLLLDAKTGEMDIIINGTHEEKALVTAF